MVAVTCRRPPWSVCLVEQAPKKKSKIGLILGIGAGVLVLLIGAIFIGSNVKEEEYTVSETSKRSKKKNKETEEESSAENDIAKEDGETIAREIANDDSIFEIDTDKYAEYSMEYTTTFKIYDKLKEVAGIYIGKIESGKPNGYGLFYYRREYTDDVFGEYITDFIYFGEWEDGSLKEGKTVKNRFRRCGKKDKINRYYILNGEWEDVDFKGELEGEERYEELNDSTGEWENTSQSEGTFKNTSLGYTIVRGTRYNNSITGGMLKSVGEFNEIGSLYNGTVYDENGNIKWTVVDGETHFTTN